MLYVNCYCGMLGIVTETNTTLFVGENGLIEFALPNVEELIP